MAGRNTGYNCFCYRSSELVGPAATKAGVIVKFSQNVLIGVAAFFIAAWWVMRKTGSENKEKPS